MSSMLILNIQYLIIIKETGSSNIFHNLNFFSFSFSLIIHGHNEQMQMETMKAAPEIQYFPWDLE